MHISACHSVLELTLGDESFWCFDRAIKLYQQRIQWLTESSRKVRGKDFIFCPLLLIPSVFVTVLLVANDRPPI